MVKNGFLKCDIVEYTDEAMELEKIGINSEETELVEANIKIADISMYERDHNDRNMTLIIIAGKYIALNINIEQLEKIIEDEYKKK